MIWETPYPFPSPPENFIFILVIVNSSLLVTSQKQNLFYITFIPSFLVLLNELEGLETCS